MKRVAATAALVLMVLMALMALCAAALASPPLTVPYTRLGIADGGAGASAVWRPDDGAAFVVQAWGNPGSANGTLRRRELLIGLDGTPALAAEPTWDAAAILTGAGVTAAQPAPAARRIHTMDEQGRTIPFAWASLDAHWRALLYAGDALGEARLAFLRGERGDEVDRPGGVFRSRASVMGDALHSVPLIVGPPAAFEQDPQYAAFRTQFKKRRTAVYVGTNDGMLHAFAADSGAELFAYIPSVLAHLLPELSSPAYRPRPYVDASAGQGDARVDGRWRTVLASGMGMGARGLFALDITDPEQFGGVGGALWEFTEQDDPAIGHVRAAPLVAKAGARHVAVAASGINPLAADGNGALFLLALDKPPGQKWKAGKNYVRIATTGADPALPNALSPPALALRADGSASHAYAGDLQGNLWRFDLIRHTAQRVFTALDGAGAPQPIGHAPAVVFAPGGGYLVLFGTGRLLEAADMQKPAFKPQSMYAIHDVPGRADATQVVARDQLARRRLTGKETFTIKGAAIDYFAPGAKRGWYFDFPNAASDGERALGSPVSVAGAVMFDTLLFDPRGGAPVATRTYVVDALSGLAIGADGLAQPAATTGHLAPLGAPVPQIVAGSALTTGERGATGDAVAIRTITLLRPDGGVARIKVRLPAARVGWREVANWQELHDRTKEKR